MIKVCYEGRLGNQLFQYGRALCSCIENDDSVENPIESRVFKYVPEKTQKLTYKQAGFFQDEETVLRFAQYRKILFNEEPPVDGLFVHVRLGDIDDLTNRSCSLDYYREAIQATGEKNGFISSDSPNHPIVQTLMREFDLKFFESHPEHTIIFASRFKNKVLSLGTFSWWIGFLNCQDNVIFPDPEKYTKWHGDIFTFEHWRKI